MRVFVQILTCRQAHNPLGSQATCPEPSYPGYRMKLLLFLAGPRRPASSGRLQANELCAPARERPHHVALGSGLSTTDRRAWINLPGSRRPYWCPINLGFICSDNYGLHLETHRYRADSRVPGNERTELMGESTFFSRRVAGKAAVAWRPGWTLTWAALTELWGCHCLQTTSPVPQRSRSPATPRSPSRHQEGKVVLFSFNTRVSK